MRALLLTGVLSLVATGCSFTTAGGLDECQTSADCGQDKVCTQGLCLPLPIGCGTVYGSTDSTAIQLGALLPIHLGTDANAGVDDSDEQASNAIRLALEQLNQRDIGGKKLTINFCDTAGDADRAKRQAEWLVAEKKVAAIITAGSSQTLAVAAVTIPANVLVMAYSASSPELTSLPDKNGGPVGLVWRTAASDSIQGSVIVNQLRNDDRFGKPKSVGILFVNDPYGQGLSDTVSQGLSAGTAPIANKSFSYPRHGDVRAAVDLLNTYDPDLTVLVGFADDATNIVKESSTRANLKRNSPVTHRWFFSDSVKDADFLVDATVVAQSQDFYGTAPAQGAGPAFKSFQDGFQGKYGKDPNNYAYTSNAYDAMYLLALSASYSQGTSGGITGPKMAEGLTKMSSSGASTQLTSSNFTYLSAEPRRGAERQRGRRQRQAGLQRRHGRGPGTRGVVAGAQPGLHHRHGRHRAVTPAALTRPWAAPGCPCPPTPTRRAPPCPLRRRAGSWSPDRPRRSGSRAPPGR